MNRYGPQTALVVVDMQNAFVHPHGALHVAGAGELVSVINAEVDAATAAGSPVVYTRDRQPVPAGRAVAASSDWQVRMYPGLHVAGRIVTKGPGADGGYSGFVHYDPATGLRDTSHLGGLLREAGVRGLVVTGLAADVCVKHTALDGAGLGYQVTVPLQASRFVHAHPDGDAAAIAELTGAGVTVEDGETR